MKIFLIDTSRPEARVALVDDTNVIAERSWTADKTLGRKLLSVLDELLEAAGWQKKNLQRIAVQRGPGHYSSLRSGIVTATMLSQGLGAELVELVTKDSLPEQVAEALTASPVTVVSPVYES